MKPKSEAEIHFSNYVGLLQTTLRDFDWGNVSLLATDIYNCWQERGNVFLCGNGGSAGNAIHLANDFVYGVAKRHGGGIRATALPANSSVLTCLGNDLGYDEIFAEQLAVAGNKGDILIVLSGSGNSPNIIRAIEQAKEIGVKSYAILGYTGGRAKELADIAIHFNVHDMQIAEDTQLVVGHMIMQWLYKNRPQV